MRLIYVIILGVSLRIGKCREEDLNEVTPKPGTLDSSLRKALLKALTELENEERDSISNDANYRDDKTVEKARASAVSIFTRTPDVATTTESGRERQIVVVQKSNGLQHRPITSFQPSASQRNFTNTEHFLASASSRHVPGQKNYITKKPSSNFNSLPNQFAFNEAKSATPKTSFTSPSPTIASPTTEESDAKVEDVQFFSAPLVAAFTVHQDARGLPKSVEPIYKQSEHVPIVTKFLNEQTSQQDLYTQDLLKREQFRNQIVLHEKQRALEEQLFKIQQQQKQQQDFLLQQQVLLQDQQKRLFDERTRVQHNDQPFVPIPNPPQNQIISQQSYNTINEQPHFNTENRFSVPSADLPLQQNPQNGALVSFQSSVSLNPEQLNKAGELPFNAQHLPVRNAIDFRESPYIQMSTYNQIQSVLTPPPNGFHHFNYAQNIDVAPLDPQQSNRVYRKEPITGNFLNSDYQVQPNRPVQYYNNVAIQPSVQLSNVRLLRSNGENYQVAPGFPAQQPIVNQHLNNLLYTSGISKGRQTDDLNIVSKILSYNHVGGENFFNGPRLYHAFKRSDKNV